MSRSVILDMNCEKLYVILSLPLSLTLTREVPNPLGNDNVEQSRYPENAKESNASHRVECITMLEFDLY